VCPLNSPLNDLAAENMDAFTASMPGGRLSHLARNNKSLLNAQRAKLLTDFLLNTHTDHKSTLQPHRQLLFIFPPFYDFLILRLL